MKERLIEFLAYIGIGQTKFEEKVGLSRGLINNIKGDISLKSLKKITEAYPELNEAWLRTGEGEMLHGSNIGHKTLGDNSPINENIEINNYKTALDMANTKIEYLEKMLQNKDEIIELLKQNKDGR